MLQQSVIQKMNKRKNIAVLFIAAFLVLTINIYSFNIQNPGFLHDIKDFNLVIQVGAFRKETNAIIFRKSYQLLSIKPVIITNEEGFYKVQITGFKPLKI